MEIILWLVIMAYVITTTLSIMKLMRDVEAMKPIVMCLAIKAVQDIEGQAAKKEAKQPATEAKKPAKK